MVLGIPPNSAPRARLLLFFARYLVSFIRDSNLFLHLSRVHHVESTDGHPLTSSFNIQLVLFPFNTIRLV